MPESDGVKSVTAERLALGCGGDPTDDPGGAVEAVTGDRVSDLQPQQYCIPR
jgi:hypothetical protein